MCEKFVSQGLVFGNVVIANLAKSPVVVVGKLTRVFLIDMNVQRIGGVKRFLTVTARDLFAFDSAQVLGLDVVHEMGGHVEAAVAELAFKHLAVVIVQAHVVVIFAPSFVDVQPGRGNVEVAAAAGLPFQGDGIFVFHVGMAVVCSGLAEFIDAKFALKC